ncbi:hypothetical protein E3N88_29196 [Mikania micrantha]|uniref:YqgF/RNase H-like domain-containing protein n=1 Tax=Mikania micrantha TaxID=192012 RepID=A0A5N6MIJ8_9ASTR|nr:hypothetical protein E3N88_29196 [Mikania micrantha]
MGSLQFHHHHHHHQIFMTPIALPPCNLRAATTTTLCLLSKLFSTCSTKLRGGEIKAINRVSADELKDQWLNSLNCAPLLNENDETVSRNQWVIGIDPDVSGALAVLKPYDLDASAQVYDSPNVKVLIGNRVRRRMDTKAIVELLQSLSIPLGTTAYIEQSLPYPGDGKQLQEKLTAYDTKKKR